MSDAPAAAPAAPQKKSGFIKWIVLSVVLLLLLGGGGAAAWWFFLRTPPAAEEGAAGEEGSAAGGEEAKPKAEKKETKPLGDGIVPMEQFLVNLADKDAQRFVRVTLRLVVETKEEAAEVEENEVTKARLRSAILELLTQQTAEVLTTVEGKDQLKKAIAERAAPILGGKKVLDVLFTDFVVQF